MPKISETVSHWLRWASAVSVARTVGVAVVTKLLVVADGANDFERGPLVLDLLKFLFTDCRVNARRFQVDKITFDVHNLKKLF